MQKKLIIAFVVVSIICSTFAISSFAAYDGSYIHTVGAYDGISMVPTFGSQYGEYGGISTLPQNLSYFHSLWNYEAFADYSGIKLSVILNMNASYPVSFFIPYEYQVSGDIYQITTTVDEVASRRIDGDGVINVSIDTFTAGGGEYVAIYSTNNYTYTLSSNTPALRVTCKASTSGQYIILFSIQFKQVEDGSAGFAASVDSILHNLDALSTIQYFQEFFSVAFIHRFVIIGFIAILISTILSWSQTL